MHKSQMAETLAEALVHLCRLGQWTTAAGLGRRHGLYLEDHRSADIGSPESFIKVRDASGAVIHQRWCA